MIRFELKRLLTSGSLILGAAILCACLLSCALPGILYSQTQDILFVYVMGWDLSAAMLILPVVSLIGYSISHFNDETSGFLYLIVSRTGQQTYITVKFLIAFLSGFMMVVLATVIFVLVAMIIRPGIMNIVNTGAVYGDYWTTVIQKGGGWLYFLLKTIMTGCFAGLWSSLGIAVSPYLKNKYIVFATPFFLCELLSIATQYMGLYLLDPYNISIRNSVGRLSFGGLPYALCYEGMLLTGLYLLFDHGIRRKHVNG